jgi:hypothetical protein
MHSGKHDERMAQNANHDQGHPPQYTGPNPEYFKLPKENSGLPNKGKNTNE